jgi:hypothetical protein
MATAPTATRTAPTSITMRMLSPAPDPCRTRRSASLRAGFPFLRARPRGIASDRVRLLRLSLRRPGRGDGLPRGHGGAPLRFLLLLTDRIGARPPLFLRGELLRPQSLLARRGTLLRGLPARSGVEPRGDVGSDGSLFLDVPPCVELIERRVSLRPFIVLPARVEGGEVGLRFVRHDGEGITGTGPAVACRGYVPGCVLRLRFAIGLLCLASSAWARPASSSRCRAWPSPTKRRSVARASRTTWPPTTGPRGPRVSSLPLSGSPRRPPAAFSSRAAGTSRGGSGGRCSASGRSRSSGAATTLWPWAARSTTTRKRSRAIR